MNATDKIFNRYYEALIADWDDEHAFVGAVRLALRLAIADTAALAQPAPQPVGHVENVTDHQRLFEYAQNQINRLNEWLDEHEPGLYISPGDTADAILNALCIRDQRIADNHEDLASARQELTALLAERDSLRQQLAQLDADNAGLIAEVDRITRLNSIAVSAVNQQSTNGANGNGLDPTTPLEWNRNHPAWNGLSDEQRVTVYRLAKGELRFRQISKEDRIDLVGRVLRHLAAAGEEITGPKFDRLRPEWMPTAGAVVLLAESRKWSELLALTMAATPA